MGEERGLLVTGLLLRFSHRRLLEGLKGAW